MDDAIKPAAYVALALLLAVLVGMAGGTLSTLPGTAGEPACDDRSTPTNSNNAAP